MSTVIADKVVASTLSLPSKLFERQLQFEEGDTPVRLAPMLPLLQDTDGGASFSRNCAGRTRR